MGTSSPLEASKIGLIIRAQKQIRMYQRRLEDGKQHAHDRSYNEQRLAHWLATLLDLRS